jgi:Rha family phage regulatory protein
MSYTCLGGIASPSPAVERCGKTIADSRDVAATFGRRHADVLATIESLEVSRDFGGRNFSLSSYLSGQNKELPCYEMTRDGFSFLVMGSQTAFQKDDS